MYKSRIKTVLNLLVPHGVLYLFFLVIIIVLLVLTIVLAQLLNAKNTPSLNYAVQNGIIGSPAVLPSDGRYVQWTFLHMNDIYEMAPLDRTRKGGVARVAYIRNLLKEENPNIYTLLGGDLVSPSALSTARINGSALNGRQMIASMNALGLDMMTFGNHEFDLNEQELLRRMNESTFAWVSTNVFRRGTNQTFGSSVKHRLITIDQVRILFIGLTIDTNQGYVQIVNRSVLVTYVQQYLRQFPNGSYDVLVAINHLDLATDIRLAQNIPEIDLILGGHEHEDYYILRGDQYTPIYRADANAITVYILRCAYNLDTKKLRIYTTLTEITSSIPDDPQTAKVVDYWFNLGIQGFRALGYEPYQTVSCLPVNIELDGKADSIRNSPTLLTDLICRSMIYATQSSGTTIAVFNTVVIRIDDILRDRIVQYDILRTMPLINEIIAYSVPGQLLAEILSRYFLMRGTGSFVSYVGVQTLDNGRTWLINGNDISTSGRNYSVATIENIRVNTDLINANVLLLKRFNITQARAVINYLPMIYPPC